MFTQYIKIRNHYRGTEYYMWELKVPTVKPYYRMNERY